ncbi:MAG: patatin-like phospholipase family protein [bacterium]
MKQKIGLALGSGGPRGLAHIGVIKALEEHKIPIEVIAGTSVGSMIGGMYLSMNSIKAIEDIFVNVKVTELAIMFSDLGLRTGIIKGDRLEKFLEGYIDGTKIQELSMPFAAVSTNLQNGRYLELTKGSLTKAIRASSSLPGFLDVANLDGKFLIDGGVSQPVPIKTTRKLGATKVIAVNLDQYSFNATDTNPGATKVGMLAVKLLRYSLALEQCREADIVITPPLIDIDWKNLPYQNDRIDIIKRGYEATIAKMDEIKKIISKTS